MGVVERQRRTHGALEAKVALRRHCAVMAGPDGDAVLVEMLGDAFNRHPGVSSALNREVLVFWLRDLCGREEHAGANGRVACPVL